MKWNKTHIGGLESGPAVTRFNGDPGVGQKYIYEARLLLGDLKHRLQLSKGKFKEGEMTRDLENGVKLFAKSNMNGLVDLDEIAIDVSALGSNSAKESDICLGFIVRITTETQTYLILNVKEPANATGINDTFWTDTEWSGGTFYTYGSGDEIPQYYGFEETFFDLSDASITTPIGVGELGYVVTERGPDLAIIRDGVDLVFPGKASINEAFTQTYDWFTESWIGDSYPSEGSADRDLYKAAWLECYSSANPGWVGDVDAGVANDAFAASRNTNSNTTTVYGLAPTTVCQDKYAPITRYYCTDYTIVNGEIIVEAIQHNGAKNSFAVCWPGSKTYKVNDDLRNTKVNFTYSTNGYDGAGLLGGIGGLIWGGSEGPLWLYTKYGIPAGTKIGPNAIISTNTDTNEDYTTNPWEMTTKVASGDYEIEILCTNDTGSHAVSVDILFAGTKHYQTFEYADVVVNGKSSKKAVIHVGKAFAYLAGSKNPFVTLKNNT